MNTFSKRKLKKTRFPMSTSSQPVALSFLKEIVARLTWWAHATPLKAAQHVLSMMTEAAQQGRRPLWQPLDLIKTAQKLS